MAPRVVPFGLASQPNSSADWGELACPLADGWEAINRDGHGLLADPAEYLQSVLQVFCRCRRFVMRGSIRREGRGCAVLCGCFCRPFS